jgi:signal transduction histidine kinase
MPKALSTVRARTTIAATVVVAAALVVGAVVLTNTLHRTMVHNNDTAARARAEEVAALVQSGELSKVLAVPDDQLVQVVAARGTVIGATRNINTLGPISDVRPPADTVRLWPAGRLIPGDDEKYRLLAQAITAPSGAMVIYVGSSLTEVDETVHKLAKLLLIGIPVLMALVALTTWHLVGRALRPVEAIRAEVADISTHDLTQRVPEPATNDEIGRLARTMNHTLDRLEASVERQRRFVADASHELQSPIAAAHTVLDVALAHPDETDWPTVASELRDENERIARLTRDLLFLARAEGGAMPVVVALVDVDDLVHTEVARIRPRARVRFDTSRVVPVEVRGDKDQLSRALRNLLENGDRYARSQVSISTRERDGLAEIVFADDGPGVPSADRDRIFERFARTDEARSRTTGGTGLGLAIAKDIITAHGGTIALADADVGATFVVSLPR